MAEQLNKRMERRAEIMKREANAAGRELFFPRSHYTSIQNVSSPVSIDVLA